MVHQATVGLVVSLIVVLSAGLFYNLLDKSERTSISLPNVHNTSYNGLQWFINEYLKLCPLKTRNKNQSTKTNKGLKKEGARKRSAANDNDAQFIEGDKETNVNEQSTNHYPEVLKEASTQKDRNNELTPLTNPKTTPKSKTNVTYVICNILLGALLLISATVALFEVFRDRLTNKVKQQTVGSTTSATSAPENRRCSLADLTMSRHARRESVQLQQQQLQQHRRLQSAASFDSSTGPPSTQRSSYRLLGARPPPLQRRSSFPVPLSAAQGSGLPTTMEQTSRPPSGSGTPVSKMSRRSSIDHSEDDSSPDTRRRVRLIRRH